MIEPDRMSSSDEDQQALRSREDIYGGSLKLNFHSRPDYAYPEVEAGRNPVPLRSWLSKSS